MISVIRDITERKQSEEALTASEEKFRKAFYASPDSISIRRLEDGVYASVNPGFTRLLGYTEDADEISEMWDEFDQIVEQFKVPLIMVPGNHDEPTTNYNTYFGVSRFSNRDYYGDGDSSGLPPSVSGGSEVSSSAPIATACDPLSPPAPDSCLRMCVLLCRLDDRRQPSNRLENW